MNRRPLVMLVTDRHRCVAGGRDRSAALVEQVAAAAAAGVDLIQVREPDLPDRELCDLVSRAVERVRGTNSVVLVNDRIDVALASGAAGVHLRADSVPPAEARRLLPPGAMLGRSVHGTQEATASVRGDALDYLVLGTVFTSRSKPGRSAVGAGRLRAVVEEVTIPVLAIGGVTVDNSMEVFRTGAAGIAAIGLFCERSPSGGFDGIGRVVGELRRRYTECHVQRG